MGANLKSSLGCLLVSGLLLAAAPSSAQKTTSRTVRKSRVAEEDVSIAPAVIEAESAIEKRDYARAEKLLQGVVSLDHRDYRAWFDLAYVFNSTERRPQAIDAYRKSIAIKSSVLESNLNLGLLLAAAGEQAEAAKYLRTATTLKPDSKDASGPLRAWLSLGRILQKTSPYEALDAFQHAAGLEPKNSEVHLSLASLFEERDPAKAESEYKLALQLDPKSSDAMAGLVNLYGRTNRLGAAETLLREYLKLEPDNQLAHLQLGRMLLKAGKKDEALLEFEEGLKRNPNDPDILRAIASFYAANKQYVEAEPHYRALVKAAPQDANLRYDFGIVLMKQRKFAEAEKELFESIRLNPKSPEVYGDLALVAAENKKFQLSIRALDERAKFVPDTPATYFLRATSYDNLKVPLQAAVNYRKFLAVAGGRFPDQEWQARHRLIAIEPEKR